MAFTYIIDTNPAVQGDANTFASLDAAFTYIYNTHGWQLNDGGDSGLITVYFRNSSGVPLVEEYEINLFTPNGTNRIEIVGQIANGYPAVLQDVDAPTKDNVLNINDDYIDIYAEEEDSFIIRGNNNNTTLGKTLLGVHKDIAKCEGLVLDGLDSAYYGGLSGSGVATLKNVKILRCGRAFYGASRAGNVAYDHCTFVDNLCIRANDIVMTNSIVKNTPLYSGSTYSNLADYNAYDVAANTLAYETTAGNANSIFELDFEANLTTDPVGGFNLKTGSLLEGAASDGTNIGAFTNGLVGEPPVISINIVGDTLSAVVSDDTTANPSLQLFVDGVITGGAQTATTWDLTSYGLTQGVYRITVQATDDDANISASNEKYYSVGNVLKILWIGNSLTNTPVEPDNASEDVIQMVEAMYAADGGQVFIDRALLGGASYIQHNANQETHDKIATGNYDIVMSQHEDDPNGGYATYEDYLNGEMKPLMDATTGVGSDWVVWSHQPNASTYDEARYNLGQSNMQTALTWFPQMQYINVMKAWWDVLQADPTIDLYADNIHQNTGGAYVSALSIYRFLTGNAVNTMTYEPVELETALGVDGLGYDPADSQLLRDTSHATITNTFVRSTANTCVVTITAPAGAITVTEGDSVTFTASAIDSSTGDLSANIIWKDGDGTTLHTGNTFTTTTLPTGKLLITANCTGSDTNVSTAARSVTVRTLVNAAPVTQDGTRTVDYNAGFTQVNLASLMSDDNDELDLNSLTITQQPTNGTATQDGQTLSTINLDFSGSNYQGSDSFKYTIADMDGLVSNESTVTITVLSPPPATGTVAGGQITRGASFTITMSNHTAGAGVEVYIVHSATEYECPVTALTNDSITAICPDDSVFASPIASVDIIVRPITSY